jgi:hypothetical protein
MHDEGAVSFCGLVVSLFYWVLDNNMKDGGNAEYVLLLLTDVSISCFRFAVLCDLAWIGFEACSQILFSIGSELFLNPQTGRP